MLICYFELFICCWYCNSYWDFLTINCYKIHFLLNYAMLWLLIAFKALWNLCVNLSWILMQYFTVKMNLLKIIFHALMLFKQAYSIGMVLVFMFYVFRRAPRPALFLKVKNAPCLPLKVKIAPFLLLKVQIAPCPLLEVKNVPCLFFRNKK